MEQNDIDPKVLLLYGKTHKIEKRFGTEVILETLEDNQSVCYGDGGTYHYLLTKLDSVATMNDVQGSVRQVETLVRRHRRFL